MVKILVTGVAGFIGSEVSKKLNKESSLIVGIDSLNNYYSLKLKKLRLQNIKEDLKEKFKFHKININNLNDLEKIFKKYKFDMVVNMAAQAGVRYSLENPKSYIDSNVVGFFNILELSRKYNIKHLVYASSSSIYGSVKKFPIKEKSCQFKPTQLYAATKISNEMMAYTYSSLFKLKTTGLRFFTVYGPWGRPDMFLFKFVDSILKNKIISIFNYGKHSRDFTFIDDIVNGTIKACFNKSYIFKNNKLVPSRVFNLAYGKSVKLLDFISIIEKNLKHKAKKKFLPLQKGDVLKTYADITLAKKKLKYSPKINYKIGIRRFIEWYLQNEKKL